jgi:hypothetical protein
MCHAIGFLDSGRHLAMRLFSGAQLANVMPAIAA